MSGPDGKPHILCAGIVVLDEVWRVPAVPPVDTKTDAYDFVTVGGGCAANAAVAIARLGTRVSFAGPIGDDDVGARTLANLAKENVDTSGCVRVKGGRSSISSILVDNSGARTIATFADPQLLNTGPANVPQLVAQADGLLIDNRRPVFVAPICEDASRRRMPIVLDADKPTTPDDPLLKMATHTIFSGESLRGTFKGATSAQAILNVQQASGGFVAVTDGANDVLWCDGGEVHAVPPFRVKAIDTLGAGDVFHGAFAVALMEGRSIVDSLRFAAAASAVKVTRFGGSSTAPSRAEVEALLAGNA